MYTLLLGFALLAVGQADDMPTVTMPKATLVHELINTEYAGQVSINNDPSYLMVFDTSACNVVTVSDECFGGECECVRTKYSYPNAKYKSDERSNVTFFDTAVATGRSVEETVQVSTLTATDQAVFVAEQLFSPELCTLQVDGVVGMAPPGCSEDQDSILEKFVKDGNLKNIFSVHHARLPNGLHFGEIIFGGSDPKYYTGDFICAPFVDSKTWNFKIDSFKIGDTDVADDNTVGFIDTSKAVILGPKDKVDKVNQAIGCTNQKRGSVEICTVDCAGVESLPQVNIVIQGTNFNISSEYYIQQKGNVCYSGFVPCEDCVGFQIGDFFIDHFYCEFNLEQKCMRIAVAVEE